MTCAITASGPCMRVLCNVVKIFADWFRRPLSTGAAQNGKMSILTVHGAPEDSFPTLCLLRLCLMAFGGIMDHLVVPSCVTSISGLQLLPPSTPFPPLPPGPPPSSLLPVRGFQGQSLALPTSSSYWFLLTPHPCLPLLPPPTPTSVSDAGCRLLPLPSTQPMPTFQLQAQHSGGYISPLSFHLPSLPNESLILWK